MNPADVVHRFLQLINQRNPDKLAELMAEGHVFVDSLGNSVIGRDQAREAWRGFYAFCPNFSVSHHAMIVNGNQVAVFGEADGTIAVAGVLLAQNAWRIPAAWHAIVENGLVAQWRVYADNKPVYALIASLNLSNSE
jgi:ketosteroid isomerase-like protein